MPLTDTPTQAELADAQAHRAAVGRRAEQIRRRRTGAIAGLVAVLVLAVAVPLALTRSTNRSEGVVTTVPPSPTTTATGSTSTTVVGTTADVGPVSLVVPPGWTMNALGCVEPSPPPTDGVLIDCPGLRVVSPEGQGTPLLDSKSGSVTWVAGTGMDCPFSDPGAGSINGSGTEVAHGFRPIGNLTAEWHAWTASCVNGPTHHVQAWFLPDSNVLFVTASDSAEIATILASVRHRSLEEYPVQIAAGTWGGRSTFLQIYPDGTGLLEFADQPPCSSPNASRPCHPSPPDGYLPDFVITDATAGPGGTWSADATIKGDNSHGDRPSLEGRHIHLAEADGRVTITGGGFVAGYYPNGQLCSASLRGTATNDGCP